MAGRNVQGVHSGAIGVLLGGYDYKDEAKFQVRECARQRIPRRNKHVYSIRLRCGLNLRITSSR
jgi:hypothetical protein